MTTKAPAGVNLRDDNDPLKKLYKAVEELSDIIPVHNERNRLSFNLNLFFYKETGTLLEAIEQASPRSSTVSWAELEKLLKEKFIKYGLM